MGADVTVEIVIFCDFGFWWMFIARSFASALPFPSVFMADFLFQDCYWTNDYGFGMLVLRFNKRGNGVSAFMV